MNYYCSSLLQLSLWLFFCCPLILIEMSFLLTQGNEQKSSELGNQSLNSVRRKGRPPKSHKIAQNFPAGNMCFNSYFIDKIS